MPVDASLYEQQVKLLLGALPYVAEEAVFLSGFPKRHGVRYRLEKPHLVSQLP